MQWPSSWNYYWNPSVGNQGDFNMYWGFHKLSNGDVLSSSSSMARIYTSDYLNCSSDTRAGMVGVWPCLSKGCRSNWHVRLVPDEPGPVQCNSRRCPRAFVLLCWWSPFIPAADVFIIAVYLTLGRLAWLVFWPQLSRWRSHNSCFPRSPWSPYQDFRSVVKWCLLYMPTIYPHTRFLPYLELLSVGLTGKGAGFFLG